jgi:hypothetical protein
MLGALSLLCLDVIAAYVVCARVQPVTKPHVSELQIIYYIYIYNIIYVYICIYKYK